jgi:predicted dienelactone hydrolase
MRATAPGHAKMRVGFRHGRSEDKARPNWDGDGPRPLTWVAWYPASDDAVEEELFSGSSPAPWFAFGTAARNAPMPAAPRRYPVVLLSHGTGGAGLGLEWLGRRLAQRGFVAIAINHHGNTGTEPYRPEGFLCLWERARDLTVLLDHMEGHAEFADRLDFDRVFVGGTSAGAYTAMALLGAVTKLSRFQPSGPNGSFVRGPREFPDLASHVAGLFESSAVFRASWARMSASYRDARFRAALVCAPGRSVLGFSEESLALIGTPARIVVGESDAVAPPQECAVWLQRRVRTSALDILPAGAGHYVFVPEATETGRRDGPDVCVDAPGVDRGAIHERVAASAAELFQAA